MKELPDLIKDNPEERESIKRLDPLIAARLAELSVGIDVRTRSGLLAGVDAVTQGNDGALWMELIAAQIAGMRRTEAQLLSRRLATAAASTRTIKAVIFYGNTLAILILLVKGFVIHSETTRRNQAEQNLKRANERLERRTSELSETNIELESFAYSVAHDLRAPLRHIAGYAGVLTQDYGPHIDADGRRCIEKIAESAQRMGRLVDDLLSLSKIGLQELSIETTPLGSVLREALKDLELESSGREIEWRIGELFSTECDPALMKKVRESAFECSKVHRQARPCGH